MEIFIRTHEGEIICCKSLFLKSYENTLRWMVTNEDGRVIAINEKGACEGLLNTVWEMIKEADRGNKRTVFVTLK